jgi:hypothetical protein
MAVPATLIYLGLDMLKGFSFKWETFFLFSIVLCLSLSFFFLSWLPFKKLFDDKAYDSESIKQAPSAKSIQLISTTSRSDLMLKLKSNQYFAKAKIVEVGGMIRIIKGMTLRSWGEIINIQSTESDGKYQYDIASIPKQQMTLIDYGVNRKNIEQLEAMLAG